MNTNLVLSPDALEDLIRQDAGGRGAKGFVKTDQIRGELKDRGVILEDGPAGSTWKRPE